MGIKLIISVAMVLALAACGKLSMPDGPDFSTYGKTVQPIHRISDSAQEGSGKRRTLGS